MTFNTTFRNTPIRHRSSSKWTNNRELPDTSAKPKGLNRIGKKTAWWNFVSKVLTEFFLRIGQPQRCELCDGTAYCGVLTPAHSRRRQDIPLFDWWYAFRVAVLGDACHLSVDSKGREVAETIIEPIIAERFNRLGLSEEDVKRILLECAEKVKADERARVKNPDNWKFDKYEVNFK